MLIELRSTLAQSATEVITRTLIGRAIGVVMERFHLPADRALELLTRVSRINDMTLEELAIEVVDGAATGQRENCRVAGQGHRA